MEKSSEPKPKSSIPGRLGGLGLFMLGLYLLYGERLTIARTGHGGRKSAVIPLIICAGLGLAIDPDARRPGIMATLYLLGAAASVAWFFLWG